jgi:hypothetical protein
MAADESCDVRNSASNKVYKKRTVVVPTDRRSTICREKFQLIRKQASAGEFWRGTDRGCRENRMHDNARLW